jgi:Flp pilus assembly protein TadD
MSAADRPCRGSARGEGAPEGDAYEWLRRGHELLASGDAAAAATLLERAARHEPSSASVLEALARAQHDSGRHGDAASTFARLVEMSPDGDYARFGLGVSLSRLGRFEEAAEHLALAVAMRPERGEYVERLRQVRATLAARRTEAR